jgi:hypothetical protein
MTHGKFLHESEVLSLKTLLDSGSSAAFRHGIQVLGAQATEAEAVLPAQKFLDPIVPYALFLATARHEYAVHTRAFLGKLALMTDSALTISPEFQCLMPPQAVTTYSIQDLPPLLRPAFLDTFLVADSAVARSSPFADMTTGLHDEHVVLPRDIAHSMRFFVHQDQGHQDQNLVLAQVLAVRMLHYILFPASSDFVVRVLPALTESGTTAKLRAWVEHHRLLWDDTTNHPDTVLRRRELARALELEDVHA